MNAPRGISWMKKQNVKVSTCSASDMDSFVKYLFYIFTYNDDDDDDDDDDDNDDAAAAAGD